MRISLLFATIAVALGLVSVSQPSLAGDKILWPDQMCDDQKIVRAIQKRFDWAQRTTFDRDIILDEIREPHQYERSDADPMFHDRRFCRGTAILSNGGHHTIYFMISYDRAPPLNGGLEWCIPTYDEMRAYAPGCAQLQPYY